MTDAAPILRLEQVRIDAANRYDSALDDASLTIHAGGLAIVLVDAEHARVPLADAAGGLIAPERGRVEFEGVAWSERTAVDAARARGRIGRVFESGGWVNNLSVGENITLARRHHGDPVQDVYDNAAEVSRWFDLPGVPMRPVHRTINRDLRRAACVRAFLGEPSLIVLERPTRGVFGELMPRLVNAVREARRRGGAVLWITSDPAAFNSRSLRPTARLRMYGARLNAIQEQAT